MRGDPNDPAAGSQRQRRRARDVAARRRLGRRRATQARRRVLEAAVDAGVTFFDTADVYGDGRSERFCGALRERHPDVFVATKMGRRVEQVPENYNRENFLAWNDRSRAEPRRRDARPRPAALPARRRLRERRGVRRARRDGRGRADRRLRRVGRDLRAGAGGDRPPDVATVQIILNCFRLKPLEQVLPAAREAGVGIIARVPLASGLLSGRYDEHTTFAARRPPQLQPPRRGVRRRRDVRRRALRGRRAGRARALGARRRRLDAGPVRAALGDRPAGREHRDPGRAQPRAGRAERRRAPRCRRCARSSSTACATSTTA